MTDQPTTDELVRLAEFCGHKRNTTYLNLAPDSVAIGFPARTWQPHLDANQRDELVEALREKGWMVSLNRWSDCWMAYASEDKSPCEKCGSSHGGHTGDFEKSTPGLAVCRAALKVIGGKI